MLPRSPLRSLAVAPFVLALLACSCGKSGDGDEAEQPPSPPQIGSGGYLARVGAGGDLELVRGESVLLSLPRGGLELGVVGALDEKFNYDPYPYYAKVALFSEPEGLSWRPSTAIEVLSAAGGPLELRVTFEGGGHGALSLEEARPGSFKASFRPDADAGNVGYLRLKARASADEGFYGLGEYFDDVNHRGKVRAMQLELDKLESSYNEAHVPVPFVIGTRGWGLFVDSPLPMVFALGTTDPTLVEATVGAGLLSKDGVTFHLFADQHPLDITRHYYDATAYPRLPARWALGPWIWRDENKDQAQVEEDIDKIRALDLATSALWIDRPYASAVNSFDFKKEQFPDPKAMIDKLHAYGLRTALWHTPYLDEADPITIPAAKEADSKGYYPLKVGPTFNKWGRPIDLTNPAAYAYWQGEIKKYVAMGVEGFKLDYGEDVVPGIGSVRTFWSFADGSDERTMHSRFSLFYHRVYAETLPDEGNFLLCRHATTGDQAHVSVIWPGDLDASFARHREQVTGDDGKPYLAVGGLPASVVAGQSLGPSGYPFFGADTGGYRHSPPDKELFVRWFEQTALSTVMQVGTSSNTVAWEKDGGPGFDDELLSLYRVYTRLHLRLFPYEWTYAKGLARDGRAIQRPLGLAYPELGAHPNDTYMFGDNLLVAPVVDRDRRDRDIVFPPGKWVQWWTGEVVEGGRTVNVKADLGTLPLYVREGGVVPLLRPTIDTLAPTTVPDQVDSYATDPGLLYARVFAGPASAFALFDGAEIGQERAQGETRLSTKGGAEFQKGAIVEVLASGNRPSQLSLDASPLAELADQAAVEASPSGWAFDGKTGSLWVKVGPGEHKVVVTD